MPTPQRFETDTIPTSGGELRITFLGHGSLIFTYQGKTLFVDPYGQVADYTQLPKADIILVCHEHHDHLDPEALAAVRTNKTTVILNEGGAKMAQGGIAMHAGEERTVQGIPIKAVPAYNIEHHRPGGGPFHPKGVGLGYVITFGDQRVYVAGDTENIPEMAALKDIDIAFLPMNLPYTMTPEMIADAARMFHPRVVYPYHYGDTDTSRLQELLKDEPGIEVRIRKLS